MRLATVLLAVVIVGGCAVAAPTPTRPAPSGCACATYPVSSPPGGLSRDAAIAAAKAVAPPAGSAPLVVWAMIGEDPFASPGSSARLVWEVRLQGSFAASPCASGFLERPASLADPACLDYDSGLVVVIDYFTGALVGWTL